MAAKSSAFQLPLSTPLLSVGFAVCVCVNGGGGGGRREVGVCAARFGCLDICIFVICIY